MRNPHASYGLYFCFLRRDIADPCRNQSRGDVQICMTFTFQFLSSLTVSTESTMADVYVAVEWFLTQAEGDLFGFHLNYLTSVWWFYKFPQSSEPPLPLQLDNITYIVSSIGLIVIKMCFFHLFSKCFWMVFYILDIDVGSKDTWLNKKSGCASELR